MDSIREAAERMGEQLESASAIGLSPPLPRLALRLRRVDAQCAVQRPRRISSTFSSPSHPLESLQPPLVHSIVHPSELTGPGRTAFLPAAMQQAHGFVDPAPRRRRVTIFVRDWIFIVVLLFMAGLVASKCQRAAGRRSLGRAQGGASALDHRAHCCLLSLSLACSPMRRERLFELHGSDGRMAGGQLPRPAPLSLHALPGAVPVERNRGRLAGD